MVSDTLRVGVLSIDAAFLWPGVPDNVIKHFSLQSIDIYHMPTLDYLVLNIDATSAYPLVHALRQQPLTRYLTMVTTHPMSALVDALTDGIATNHTEAEKLVIDQRKLRQAFILSHDPRDYDTALLQFLYTRPEKILTPIRSLEDRNLYQYPLVECFVEHAIDINVIEWLNQLIERRLLERIELLDRLFCCSHCRSARLQFFNRCPLCQSIDISAERFFHCFTCGHVDIEERFVQYDRLRCPRCQEVLRHIGTDYDRPMENYHCQHCAENFTEPETQTRCLDCEKIMDPDKLQSTNLYSCKLSKVGKHSVLNHTITDVATTFNRLNYIAPNHFKYTINWLLRLAQRDKSISFTLMCIYFNNMDDLMARIGTHKMQMILQDYSKYLRELIRITDLSTHTDADCIWLLLPQTSTRGAFILKERIDAIPDKLHVESSDKLESKITFLTTEDCDLANDTAESLFTRLLGID